MCLCRCVVLIDIQNLSIEEIRQVFGLSIQTGCRWLVTRVVLRVGRLLSGWCWRCRQLGRRQGGGLGCWRQLLWQSGSGGGGCRRSRCRCGFTDDRSRWWLHHRCRCWLHHWCWWCNARGCNRCAPRFQHQLPAAAQCFGDGLFKQRGAALHHGDPIARHLNHGPVGVKPNQLGLLRQQHAGGGQLKAAKDLLPQFRQVGVGTGLAWCSG